MCPKIGGKGREMTAEEYHIWRADIANVSHTSTNEEIDIALNAISSKEQADKIREEEREAKRPKRSEINRILSSINSANTIPQIKSALLDLATIMLNVLDVQNIEIVEDEE